MDKDETYSIGDYRYPQQATPDVQTLKVKIHENNINATAQNWNTNTEEDLEIESPTKT